MTLATQIIADLSQPFVDWGTVIEYQPADDVPSTITVILDVDEEGIPIQDDAPPGNLMRILVKTADVAEPNYNDKFIINPDENEDEETWYLRRVLKGNSRVGTWLLEMSKSERRRL